MSGRFYDTQEWKRLRAQKLRENPVCEMCGREKATEVDHKLAISAGGSPTDLRNLRAMCRACHSRKTLLVERMGKDRVPVKGCTVDGLPLDRGHWWNKRRSQR